MQSATFFDHYKAIVDKNAKRKLRKRIIQSCEIEPATFYTWFQRRRVPRLAQRVISELMQKPVDTLFPNHETPENND